MNTLFVCLRVYPKISKRPFYGFQSKLQLFEVSLLSLKNSLNKLDYNICIIFDCCPESYTELADQIFNEKLTKIIFDTSQGNSATFLKQLEICTEQSFSDNIFIVEDDYLFKPKELSLVIDYLTVPESPDFITPYDHFDYYNLWIHQNSTESVIYGDKVFREVCSTTLTFITRKRILVETRVVFDSFKNNNYDASIFFSLTKSHVFSIKSILKSIFCLMNNNSFYLKALIKSWIYCHRQILFGRKYSLKSVSPSVATHMQYDGLAPNVDWNYYLSLYLRKD